MKSVLPIVLLLGLGVLLYYESGQQFANEYSFQLKSVSLNGPATEAVSYSELILVVNAAIVNPTAFAINVRSVYLDVYLNSVKVATVNTNSVIALKGNTTTLFSINLAVPLANLLLDISDVLNIISNQQGLAVSAVGTITADVGTLNVNQSQNLFQA